MPQNPTEQRAERIATLIETYDHQGIHRTGTKVDRESAFWLAHEIEKLGVEPVLQSFMFNRVEVLSCGVRVGPTSLIPATPLYDCGHTSAQGITGTVGNLGSDSEIGVAFAPPSENTPEQLKIFESRRKNQHKAIIVITPSDMPATGTAVVNAEQFREPFGPPVLQIAFEHWHQISGAIEADDSVTVVVETVLVESEALNVGATVVSKSKSSPSNNPSNKSSATLSPLVVMTPRSGWWQCASERGGGIAAFLTMMEQLQQRPVKRDVIFTANTGHELSHIGLDHYLDHNPELINHAHCWIHLGANFAANNGTVIVQHSDKEVSAITNRFLESHQLQPDITIDQTRRPFGEARNVFDGGGRYLSLLGSNPLFHHPADRWPEAVDLKKTVEWTDWIVDCAIALAD